MTFRHDESYPVPLLVYNSNCSNFLLPAARILSKQQVPEADEAWRALIQHNPDRYESFRGYLENLGLPLGKS
jgi:hypothetical protein